MRHLQHVVDSLLQSFSDAELINASHAVSDDVAQVEADEVRDVSIVALAVLIVDDLQRGNVTQQVVNHNLTQRRHHLSIDACSDQDVTLVAGLNCGSGLVLCCTFQRCNLLEHVRREDALHHFQCQVDVLRNVSQVDR